MNKKIISFFVFTFLLGFFSFVGAQQVPDPLGGKFPNFCSLLTHFGNQVGMFIAGLGTIMVMVAGIMFLFSAGSPERMQKAKTALVYAIIGITIGVSASAIVATVKNVINASGGSC